MKYIVCKMRGCAAGVSSIEYALIASIISVAAAGVLITIGSSLAGIFTRVSNGF